jgi:hypothetical protein
VMPEAGDVGEAKIENSNVVLPGEVEDGLGISHESSLHPGMFQ